jgi:hypothetical protein
MINIFYQPAFVGWLRECKYSSTHGCGTYKGLMLLQDRCKLNLVLAMSKNYVKNCKTYDYKVTLANFVL